jgi:hypothetical protein
LIDFLKVARDGDIRRVGYFLPHAGSTSAAYWLKTLVVYAVDYTRGIDILGYNGAGTDGPLTDANQNEAGARARPPGRSGGRVLARRSIE